MRITGRIATCDVHNTQATGAMRVMRSHNLPCLELSEQWSNRFAGRGGNIFLDPFFGNGMSKDMIDQSSSLRLMQTAVAGAMISSVVDEAGVSLSRAARMLSWSPALRKLGPQWLSQCWANGLQPEHWALSQELQPPHAEMAAAWLRRGGVWRDAILSADMITFKLRSPEKFRESLIHIVGSGHHWGTNDRNAKTNPAMLVNLFKIGRRFDEHWALLNRAQALCMDPLWGGARSMDVNGKNVWLESTYHTALGKLLDPDHVSCEDLEALVKAYGVRLAVQSDPSISRAMPESIALPIHGNVRLDTRQGVACDEGHVEHSLCAKYLRGVLADVGNPDSPKNGVETRDVEVLRVVVDQLLLSRLHSPDYGDITNYLVQQWRLTPMAWPHADLLPGYAGLPILTGKIPECVALGLTGEEVDHWTKEGILEPWQIYLATAIDKRGYRLPDGAIAQMASAWSHHQFDVLQQGLAQDEDLLGAVLERQQNGYPVNEVMCEMFASEFQTGRVLLQGSPKPSPELLRADEPRVNVLAAFLDAEAVRKSFAELAGKALDTSVPDCDLESEESSLGVA